MAFSIDKKDGSQILKLTGVIIIRDAQNLAALLAESLEDGVPIRIETDGLEDIDTCILQLLCSLSKTAPELSFENPSEAFLGAVDRCGFRRELLAMRGEL
jgi:anti-anti-sigma regulatory factor